MNRPPSPLNMLLSRHTRRRDFITLIGGAIATWPPLAHGQQNRKPWRIGIPADIPPSAATTRRFGAFRDGLKELGYAEGSNIVIDYRDADGSRDGLIALCKDMIASGADVIVAGSTNAALAAQITTKTVPIVMRAAADPVAVGLVESSSAARREHYRRYFSGRRSQRKALGRA